jgi:hypothetical protein
MAIVTATITVDFTANYAGPHRVCFRIQGSGDPYDCSTAVNCIGGGTACQAIINTLVNTTSCDGTVIFEGYIQATCEDILSTNGRLPWTANFVPNQVCDKFNILCELGPIIQLDDTDRGVLYDLADTVIITRQPGDNATVDAVVTLASVGDGVINSITSGGGGVNYAALDTIDITGGGGGAGAQIRVDTVDGGGAILTYTLVANGAGYYNGPFSTDVTSGSGVGASFNLVEGTDYDDFGSIQTFNIVNGGEYEITPVVSFGTASGQDADFSAVLGGCGIWTNVGADCVGGDQVDIADLAMGVGDVFATCLEGGLATAIPARYSVTELGCCIPEDTAGDPCVDIHVENLSGGPVDIHLTLCNGDDATETIANGITEAFCVVTNGWIDPYVAGVTVTDTGTPCT